MSGYPERIATTTPAPLVAGRWRLDGHLGRGAVADVYAAIDDTTGEPVAVKLLRSVDPDQIRRFERELDALETLDHPGVVALLDHGVHERRPFLVLERCDGGTLASLLTAGAVGVPEAARIGADLADGLAHAHGHGVVHRDVKPSNVLLASDGTAKLADFGIARLEDRTVLTGTGWTIGTAAYLAPEQARGESVGPAADVYSLGLVVLEAATGRRAFEGAGMAAAMARLQRDPDIPEDLPKGFRSVLATMTAMDPADRPAAVAVAAWLRDVAAATDDDGTAVLPLLADPTTAIPVAAVAPEAPATRRRRPAPAWLVPAACFAVGFLAVVLLGLALAADDDGGAADPTTTTIATTTVPPTTAQAPPPVVDDEEQDRGDDEDEDRGDGNGRGNGNGRGRDGNSD